MRILVVEDDTDISTLISFHLRSNGFESDSAYTGREAIEMIDKGGYALILLDILLPEVSGLEVLEYIRKKAADSRIPVIVTSAMSEESDIIKALELGADDYVTKPFSPKILLARIRSAIRRADGTQEGGNTIKGNGIILDTDTRKAFLDENPVSFTATEFDILSQLMKSDGRVLSRGELIETIKGDDYPVTERSIDVQIASIRKKLGEKGQYIKTVWGIGYRYAEE